MEKRQRNKIWGSVLVRVLESQSHKEASHVTKGDSINFFNNVQLMEHFDFKLFPKGTSHFK